jgi:hypothetical protein
MAQDIEQHSVYIVNWRCVFPLDCADVYFVNWRRVFCLFGVFVYLMNGRRGVLSEIGARGLNCGCVRGGLRRRLGLCLERGGNLSTA